MKAGANSGKKQRLKLKVARTTQRSSSSRTPSDTATIQAQPAHDFRLKGVPTDLFTVFHVREAAYEVDKRIIASRQPLTRRSLQVDEAQLYQEVLDIPTRPAWTPALKAKRLHELEEASFEAYLTSLYALYPPTRLNHFEHNLQVWRQLWRACEMSDVLLLTADARHPLFHFPPSLYRHITRTLRKPLLLVLNKVDLVDARTLKGWVGWFERRYPELEVVCFSSYPQGEGVVGEEVDVAVKRKERKREGAGGKRQPAAGVREVMAVLERRLREKLAKEGAEATQDRVEERKEDHDVGTDATAAAPTPPTARRSRARTREKAPVALDGEAEEEEGEDTATKAWPEREEAKESAQNAGQGETSLPAALPDAVDAAAPVTAHRSSRRMARLAAASTETSTATDTSLSDLSAAAAGEEVEDEADEHSDEDELVTLHAPAPAKPSRSSILIVGVIGHPNAGKSSLINALFGRSVVSASETPGHTKHLQTLALTPRIAIVDAPGLVFPAVDMPRELQVLCGIFPISQLREPYTAIAYLAERVPLETIYALKRLREDDTSEGRAGGKRSEGGEDDVREVGASLAVPEDEVEWSAWELCEAYARQRGFSIKGSNGRFDTHKAANEMLHDVLSGVVAFNFKAPPPNAA